MYTYSPVLYWLAGWAGVAKGSRAPRSPAPGSLAFAFIEALFLNGFGRKLAVFFGHKMSTVAEKSLALELPITALEMPILTWLVPAVATRRWCSARQVHLCRRKVSLTTPWSIIKWTVITHTRHGRLGRPCHVGTIWCRIYLNDEWNAGKLVAQQQKCHYCWQKQTVELSV